MGQHTFEQYLLLNPNLDLDQIDSMLDAYIQILNKHGCIIISKEIWGERNLAYPIEKNKKTYQKAYYIMILFKSLPAFMNTLYALNDLNPNILKQIFVDRDIA